jgi:hypothetical protein
MKYLFTVDCCGCIRSIGAKPCFMNFKQFIDIPLVDHVVRGRFAAN